MKVMRILVIGGFLGSGKTSTIIRMGKYLSKQGAKVAIIVNEIGEVSIDGDLISSYGFDIIELTKGCICCTLKRDMRYTINTIRKNYDPDFLLIEPTGIAFPTVIRDDIMLMNLNDVDIAPLITLIDGSRFKDIIKETKQFFERQIIDAEIIAISKVDLVEEIYISIIESSIKELNSKAKIIRYSAKSDSIAFSNFMDFVLKSNINFESIIQRNSKQVEDINSIDASGTTTYATEFILRGNYLDIKNAEDISCSLLKEIRDKIVALNPSFVGHIKSILQTNTVKVKTSITAYYEDPQIECIKSFSQGTSLKILAAVSNVTHKELIDCIDFCVQKVFARNGIQTIKKIDHYNSKNHVEVKFI